MNRVKAFLYHLGVEFLTGFRNKSILFINYFLPLFFYVMMGVVMTQINEGFADFMQVSMMLFAIMTSTLLTVPSEVTFARAEGVFRSYKIYGISRLEILLHYTFNSMLHSFITCAIIFFTAGPLFGARQTDNLPMILLAVVLYFFANMGICFLVSVLFSVPKVAGLIAQAVFIPSILAGGLMIPLDTLPESLSGAVRILPSTHVMNVFQLESTGLINSAVGCTVFVSLMVLAAFIVVSYVVAIARFQYNNK